MSKNYLLLVEGEDEAKLLSSLLNKEGFNIITKKERIEFSHLKDSLIKEKFSNNLDNVILLVSKNVYLDKIC